MSDFLFFTGGIALPLVSLITGIILWRNPPGRNAFFGFRSKLSMSDDDIWQLAQTYCGRLMTAVFSAMTALAVIVNALVLAFGADGDGKFTACVVLLGVSIAALIFVNIAVDKRLKKAGEPNE